MTDQLKILFFTADPVDTSRIRVDQEVREVDEMINSSRLRDRFCLIHQPAARPKDLQRALLRHNPHIVHFSGHSSAAEGLAFEDSQGKRKPISPELLAELFDILPDNIRIVVLNACYSNVHASAISKIIDFTVAMQDKIGDQSAILFSSAFYLGLAEGRSVEAAYRLGVHAIKMEGFGDAQVPAFLVKPGADASKAFLSATPPEEGPAAKIAGDMKQESPNSQHNHSGSVIFNAPVHATTVEANGQKHVTINHAGTEQSNKASKQHP